MRRLWSWSPRSPLSSPGLRDAPSVPAPVSILSSFHSFSPFSPFSCLLLPLSGSGPLSLSPDPSSLDFNPLPRRPLSVPWAPLVFPARFSAPLSLFPAHPRLLSPTARNALTGPAKVPRSALISPSSSPEGASPELPGQSPSSRPREPRWPPGGPSCQGRWVYFRSCIACPQPRGHGHGSRDSGNTSPARSRADAEPVPPEGLGPLARQAAAPRLWMAVSKKRIPKFEHPGSPGLAGGAFQRRPATARPPRRGRLGTVTSPGTEAHRSFPSLCPLPRFALVYLVSSQSGH